MKKIHFLLIYLLIPAMVFSATSLLIKPHKGSIIDIGTRNPINKADIIIQKDWIDIAASLKRIDLLVYPKKRNEERHDCLIDDFGVQNCPLMLSKCKEKDDYISGLSEKVENFREQPTIKTTFKVDKFYPSLLRYGVTFGAGDIDLYAKGYSSSGTLIYDIGWHAKNGWSVNGGRHSGDRTSGGTEEITIKTKNWKDAGVDYVEFYIHAYSNKNLEDFNAKCFYYDEKNKKRTFDLKGNVRTKVLMRFDLNRNKITNLDSSVILPKIDIYECPEGYERIDKDKDDNEKPGTCRIDYVYYNYSCPTEKDDSDEVVTWDSSNPNGIWVGPLISTGGDCGGIGLNSNKECQSPTPPAKNCLRISYTCPIDKNKKCTKVPNDLRHGDSNYEDNYIYSKGNAIEFAKTLVKDKSCKEGSTYNAETDSCLSENSYKCLEEGFTYEPIVQECVKVPSCPGMLDPDNGDCLTLPEFECEAAGYEYNAINKKCEKNPFCDKGTFNTAKHLCEESGNNSSCPLGYTYNESTSRCEKELETIIRDNCAEGFTYSKSANKCTMATADFTDWTVYGNDSDWDINGATVTQKENGDNTFLISPYSLGTSIVLEGKFKVDNDGDDDWAGIVFGWEGTSSLYIFDWKKADQGHAKRGLRLMHVTDYGTNLWKATNTEHMTLLASNFSYPGWSYGKTYTLRVQYTFHQVIAYIDGEEVLRYEDPNFELAGGKVGFFNLSQSKVTYKDYYIESDPTCDAGYTYSIEYDTCYIDDPNAEEDLELGISWVYPSCPGGHFNESSLKCEYSVSCSDFGKFNSRENICQLPVDINCPDNTTVTETDYSGYETACRKTEPCPDGTYLKYFKDLGEMCVSGKLPSCEKGESLNETLNACESTPFCEKGYKVNKEGKCYKDYYWYNYTCDEGWEGPAKPGKDCLGNCGDFGCSCSPKTPLPNNCRKPVSDIYSEKISSLRQMILHNVTGSLTPAEFGVVKTYECGDDCLYSVDSIKAKENKLCFHKKNGENKCFEIENCHFYGEIKNKEGIKELQVGVESDTANKGLYQYTLAEGSKIQKPEIANPDTISCFDDSTKYFPSYRECRMSDNLDLRDWIIYGADAKWEFTREGTVGHQKINTTKPTLLLHPTSFGDSVQLSGKLMTTDRDDDWIGLAFGVKDSKNYYRFTWHATGGGNSNSGFDISKIKNGRKSTLVSDIVSGGSKGYSRGVWYTFGVTYAPGLIIGYVNNKEVLRYTDPDLKITGKVGFYGFSQANVYYKNFSLSSSPKCPTGYFYQSIDKQCMKLSDPSDLKNVIHSTCKMNGHVGYFDNDAGIISAMAGSEIPTEIANEIKTLSSSTFIVDDNKTKDPSHRIEFWNSYSNAHYLGFIEFIKDVKDEDRVDGFSPVNKLPYSIGEEGFTAINNLDGYTYFVSVDSIGFGMSEEDCDDISVKYGLERRTSFTAKENIFLKILAGNRYEDFTMDPVCSDGNYNPVSKTCENAKEEAPFRYCQYGKLTTDSKCIVNKRCILRTPNLDIQTFNTSDQAYKTTYTNGESTYKCSPFVCKEGACKIESCPKGYNGKTLPAGVEVPYGTCTSSTCDGNKPYIPYCGKPNGCPKGPEYLYTESKTGPCYEYYCKDGGTFDPETKKCKVHACPANTHEISDGTCRRD